MDEPIPPAAAPTGARAWLRQIADADASIKWGERIVQVVVFTLVVFGGVAFLYSPNATWGTPADFLTAILWAAGIQEVSNASFSGVVGLRAQVEATGASIPA